jgi:hypothetical protein
MQAWDQVKVAADASQYNGRAGLVERVEKKGDVSLVYVRLDKLDAEAAAPLATFDPAELVRL